MGARMGGGKSRPSPPGKFRKKGLKKMYKNKFKPLGAHGHRR